MTVTYAQVDHLRTAEPFSILFPIRPHTLQAVAASMRANGYDDAEPIVTWNGLVIDGHTRLAAAMEANLYRVAVVEHNFYTEDEALEYAIRRQRDRRNLTDADLFRCLEVLDQRKDKSNNLKRGPEASSEASGDSGKSAEKTAELLGTSRAKVERARQVLDKADDETKAKVLAGEKSINAAVTELRKPADQPCAETVAGASSKASPAKTPACECEALRARVAELEEQLEALNQCLDELKANNEAMSRVLDAEDLLTQFNREVVRANSMSTATQTRNNQLMSSLHAANKDAERWKNKYDRLERKMKGQAIEPELDSPPPPPPDDDPDWFTRDENEGAA